MKQVEITVKVENTLDEIHSNLESKGFHVIRKSRVEDIYISQKKVNKNNIFEVLASSVLLRYLKIGSEEFKKITYKNKEYKNGEVVSESKISVTIDNIENAWELFEKLGFERVVNVNYDVIVYKNDCLELAFQMVEGLGLLLEVESLKDFSNSREEEMLLEKKKLLGDIQKLGLKISSDKDIKKAYELIQLRFN